MVLANDCTYFYKEVRMRSATLIFAFYIAILFTTNTLAQPASILWPLANNTTPNSPLGNIQGNPESLGAGPAPTMSVFGYTNDQRLWVGNTGWVAGTIDFTRFIQFDANPTAGNNLNITNVSFNYGDYPLSTNFNMLRFQAYYSTDGWNTSTLLNSTPLVYLNTTVSVFTQSLNVTVLNGQTFSLRIYPYAVQNGSPMTPTFAIHDSVLINATSTPISSICGTKYNDLNGNGVRDPGEPGLPNWKISMNIATHPAAITDAQGNYCFSNVTPGTYTISEVNQSGWVQTAPASPGTYTLTVAAGQQISGINFGNTHDTSEACIIWNLLTDSLVSYSSGNITGQPESLSPGTSAPFMSAFPPYSNGQRLWVGNTGWVAGPLDPQRYIEFNVSPTPGNTYTVNNVSSNYGDLPLNTNFNILNFKASYSIDGWINSTDLNLTGLVYLNTTMTLFNQAVSVLVPAGKTFSLRIFPYALQNGIAMTPSFAIHNNITICGKTSPTPPPASICGTKFNDLNGNGVRDPGEPGLPNWKISMNIATHPAAITDAQGNYCFDNVTPGTYTISEVNQSGWVQTAPASPGTYTFTVAAGQQVAGINFGNTHDTSESCIMWNLQTDSLVSYVSGNITGQAESLSPGSSAPFMSAFPPHSNGQRLWVGNTGWVAGPLDPLRFVEFNVSPTPGNNYTVTNVSFNYGDLPLSTNFNILNFKARYSIDGWINSTDLNLTGLVYLNTTMTLFTQAVSVIVPSGKTFSLRIFPYALQNGIAMTPTFAIHNNVTICGTTTKGKTPFCTDFEDGLLDGWQVNNALEVNLASGGNHYLETTDESGSSFLFSESPAYQGNWLSMINDSCGALCFDIKYVYNGDPFNNTNPPLTMTPSIGIAGNGFSASFITPSPITVGDGWHTFCAPIAPLNGDGTLPSNSDGHWVMSTGTAANWNSMLTNITRVTLPVDPTSYQSERIDYDNICIKNTGDCKSHQATLCDSLKATAVQTSPGDCCWTVSIQQPATLNGVNSIQIVALSPNSFTTGTGLGINYQTWFTSGTNTYTSSNGDDPGGNLNNFFNMCLSYVTSPQRVVVRWLNSTGGIVCADTLLLNCETPCTVLLHDTVTCTGNTYNLAYTFKNNAGYSISNIDYTVLHPGTVTVSPTSVVLSPLVAAGANSQLQNIQIAGALPGDTVSIWAKYKSPDGCCWCYDSIRVIMPSCKSICDSLTVQAVGSPDDCCYAISLMNNSSMAFSSVQFVLLSGGMFSTVATTSASGWGFTNIFPNNLINLVKFPFSSGIGTGTFNNVLNMCIRQYSSASQVIEVRWIKNGQVVCRDTLQFNCTPTTTHTDTCSQAINGTVECLANGMLQYKFRVQNNSNINSSGYGIFPMTPGVTFSKTIFNTVVMPGQVSPLDSVIVSGMGNRQTLCFQTAIFTTGTPGDTVYNYCCHSDTMCITVPNCKGDSGCVKPPSGMVAWWSFDEISGSIANDLAGFNNAGTYHNGPLPVSAKVLSGLLFDGISAYVEAPDQAELNFGTGDFSFDAWIKTTSTTGMKQLVDKRSRTVASMTGYSFFIINGRLGVQLDDGSFTNYNSTVFVADGNWHHIAITVSRASSTGILFYADGVSTQFGDPTLHLGSVNSTSPLRIGCESYAVDSLFTGILDEIELFNRALTPAEVISIYAAGSAGKCKIVTETSIEKIKDIPKSFGLLQSFPNPFNPSATIRYDIPVTSFVKIGIYDILGKEIKILVHEEKSPGHYSVIFDASGLPSGIYFYTIQTGTFTQKKKMILMK